MGTINPTYASHAERAALRKRVAEFVRSGGTIQKACTEFGVALGTVYRAMKEEDVPVPVGRSLGSNAYLVIADLCNTNDSTRVIAERLGISPQRVSQINQQCKRAGVPVRKR
jgi:hypothetical protein